jgi:hypothetical protein
VVSDAERREWRSHAERGNERDLRPWQTVPIPPFGDGLGKPDMIDSEYAEEAMSVVAMEGVVGKGLIRLVRPLVLADGTKVYVIVPESESSFCAKCRKRCAGLLPLPFVAVLLLLSLPVHAQYCAYVTNVEANNRSVIDTAKATVVGTISFPAPAPATATAAMTLP